MKVLISGASGLVGSRLLSLLQSAGHECRALTRRPRATGDIGWNPAERQIDATQLEGFDAVVHLAGESIAEGRWSTEKKARIRDSRVLGTELLCRSLAATERKPQVLVSASAIGFYGDRADERLNEESTPGDSFLADVCRQWEGATQVAADAGMRVVNSRFGIILSADGGALQKMLTPFRLGGGGIVGSGRQYWSWITLDDVAAGLRFAIEHDSLSGPVNFVSPQPSTNREFTQQLGRVLHRPTLIPLPAFAARLVLGEMADELLLASARVYPDRLTAAGFTFQHADLEHALRAVLSN